VGYHPDDLAANAVIVDRVPVDVVFSNSSKIADLSYPPPVEWWFIQGYYENPHMGRRYVMCTLFRFSRLVKGRGRRVLHHLLVSVLNPETGANIVISQADPDIAAWMEGYEVLDQDSDLFNAYVAELREYGVPQPITMGPSGLNYSNDPFFIHWGDLSIETVESELKISFPHPAGLGICQFSLDPVTPAWYCPLVVTRETDGMAYASIPRLTLHGTVDGEKVSGEVWMDHQWGGLGWFSAPAKDPGEERIIRGWDWYAINLDSGTDIMVIIQRNMVDRQDFIKKVIFREKNSEILILSDITLTQSNFWTSPVTGITYPLSADITIPGIDGVLTLSPLSNNQEILIPGPMRAVWEGASRVDGTIRGRKVSGRGRIELFGYGYILDFKTRLTLFSQKVDDEISRFLPSGTDEQGMTRFIGRPLWVHEPRVYTDAIARPAWDLLRRNKKYYRSIYAILLLHTLGVASEPYFDIISVIPELNHTGALIIDDIEDSSPLRRGEPSIHINYGLATAINAANTLYYLPWLLIEGHPHISDHQRLLLYEGMVKCAVKAHFGQGLGLYWTNNRSPDQVIAWTESGLAEKVLQMHADKTGVSGELIADTCCIIAGVPDEVRMATVQFSKKMWVAFQIVDDVKDITGGPEWRKEPGEDIASGTLTYVLVKALGMLKTPDTERLAMIIALPREEKDESLVLEGLFLVKKSGAVQVCMQEAIAMMEFEWHALSLLLPPSGPKVLLRAFCHRMLSL
jgi:geranylgeranyl pyrophosphate synthase/predicted secreted hydrolase